MAINYGTLGGTLGGTQVGATQQTQQPTNYGAQGVAASPNTPASQPGWTYGANPTQNQIQGTVAPGQTDISKIGAASMPVTSIQGGQPY